MTPDTYVGENISLKRARNNTLTQPEYDLTLTEKISKRAMWENIRNYFTFLVLIKKEGKGYVVSCPELKGCWSEGDSLKEAEKNIIEAIQLYLDIDFKPKIVIEKI